MGCRGFVLRFGALVALVLGCVLPGYFLARVSASNPPLRVSEVDGSPSRTGVWWLKVPNGWLSVSGGVATLTVTGLAPSGATYVTQTADSTLSAEQALSGLSSGIMRVATTTGVVTSLTDSGGIASNISDETGSGALVFGTSPSLVTPALGTPSAVVLTHGTGLPEAGLSLADVTTANAGAGAHGLLPKLDSVSTHFLSGAGTWLTPAAGVGGSGTSGKVAVFTGSATIGDGLVYQDGTDVIVGASGARRAVFTANGSFSFGDLDGNDNSGVVDFDEASGALSCSGGIAVSVGQFSAGDVVVSGGLTLGGGAVIAHHLSATATLDFGNLAAIGCEDLTIPVTGAASGDTVTLGVPVASVVANGFFGEPWVSSSGVVSVRFCTVVSGNPASGVFRADVWQH